MNRCTKFDALSSAEKSSTVQTHKKSQTVTDIFTSCLSACVDNKLDSGRILG